MTTIIYKRIAFLFLRGRKISSVSSVDTAVRFINSLTLEFRCSDSNYRLRVSNWWSMSQFYC